MRNPLLESVNSGDLEVWPAFLRKTVHPKRRKAVPQMKRGVAGRITTVAARFSHDAGRFHAALSGATRLQHQRTHRGFLLGTFLSRPFRLLRAPPR